MAVRNDGLPRAENHSNHPFYDGVPERAIHGLTLTTNYKECAKLLKKTYPSLTHSEISYLTPLPMRFWILYMLLPAKPSTKRLPATSNNMQVCRIRTDTMRSIAAEHDIQIPTPMDAYLTFKKFLDRRQ